MSDETLTPAVDLDREITLLRAGNAPLVYFDLVTTQGLYLGMCNVTLEYTLHTGTADGRAINGRQVAASLRFPLSSLPMLKEAVQKLELLAQPPASDEKN